MANHQIPAGQPEVHYVARLELKRVEVFQKGSPTSKREVIDVSNLSLSGDNMRDLVMQLKAHLQVLQDTLPSSSKEPFDDLS